MGRELSSVDGVAADCGVVRGGRVDRRLRIVAEDDDRVGRVVVDDADGIAEEVDVGVDAEGVGTGTDAVEARLREIALQTGAGTDRESFLAEEVVNR